MKIHYYPETHSMWVVLADRPSANTEEIGPGVQADFDATGQLVAIEVLNTSQLDMSELEVRGVPLIKMIEAPARRLTKQ